MVIIKKFLCFELEVGGLFIAWYTLIYNIFFVPLMLYNLIFFVDNCESAMIFWEIEGFDKKNIKSKCYKLLVATNLFFVFSIASGAINIVISIKTIKGIITRVHFILKPMTIMLALEITVSVFFTIAGILSLNYARILVGIIIGAVIVYAFIVINSLHKLLRQEYIDAI